MRLVSSPFLYWIRLICAIIYCKLIRRIDKEKIIEYILKNSENPDFTKAYQYSQVNSSKELIKK